MHTLKAIYLSISRVDKIYWLKNILFKKNT